MSALPPFQPVVQEWFARRFPAGPTGAQRAGWPLIAAGRDVLIAAPTGSGKTLAAFLVCIDRLLAAGREAPLPDAVDVVYVSPLKALARDIHQNLEIPLAEIGALARARGIAIPEVRAQVRTGDTTPSARAAMARRPPHLLVTTPESLYLLVTAQRSREQLRGVRAVIVDEIHAVARDKRGSHLSLTLERLEALAERRPQRIGLSATQRPIETIARLLVGAPVDPVPARPAPAREVAADPTTALPAPIPGRAVAADPTTGLPAPASARAVLPTAARTGDCAVVDLGHRRALDLAIELPESELQAVMSHEQWDEILDGIARHVEAHRTTLVFVNTRRLAERLAHRLGERLGPEQVAAHHGSLSRDRRFRLEERLRAGDLRALVATASLELGIDIGPVELVCQIGSPRSLGTFLQRVGRSGHALGATPKGRLYPTTRDELVESAALLRGVRAGKLDAIEPPRAPLDILAQQIVAACAAEAWGEDDLYALVRRAAPYADLARADFDDVVEMLAEGIQTGRGRRGAYLHRDRVNGVLRGRRSARIAALTSGGAIPETADYKVVADPDDTVVGTVNEDWAIESMGGDVFLLGSTSWRIRRVEPGIVRVVDAAGAPPSVPFWLGEAPARTAELSVEVSELRARVAEHLEHGDADGARAWLEAESGVSPVVASEIVRYLGAGQAALGVLPTQRDVVFERFFDETGGMQLVIHAPFGGRVNRALGLALRKRFCRSFDFELQAAADDDAVVLSLGAQQSFPLSDVPRFLSPRTARETLEQALLVAPAFQVRWRWNLGRALTVLRQRGGKRNPPPIQRMEADDLMAAVFPGLAACQDNAPPGPIEVPEHPLVRQTLHDCLHEATDVDGLVALLEGIEAGVIRTHFRESPEPSPLAHEILNGRPYTFLDDAPLEERRTRAVALRRGLPESARDLGQLDPDAVARVREEARPDPRDPEELHDVLLELVALRPEPTWAAWFDSLVSAGRAATAAVSTGPLWLATERRPLVDALYPGASVTPDVRLAIPSAGARSRPRRAATGAAVSAGPPDVLMDPDPGTALALVDPDAAAALALRGHLAALGPCTADDLAARTGLTPTAIAVALAQLEAEGFLLRGRFDPARAGAPGEEVCERRLLARIHRYTTERLRREIEPVTAQDFMRFLLRWQHVAPGTQLEGRDGVLAAIEQLQGFEIAASAWETAILPARVAEYRSPWLDDLCLTGAVMWARLGVRAADGAEGGEAPTRGGGASRATPISFLVRDDLPGLLAVARGAAAPVLPSPGAARDLLECLRARGALFFSELVAASRRLRVEAEEGLWDLVARGLVTADGFGGVRALLSARERWARRSGRHPHDGLRRRGLAGRGAEGRWSLLATESDPWDADLETRAEAAAGQLLARYGVVFHDLAARETLALPWREILRALRRLEARGTARGGRFVTGFVGEQYALPEAVEALRHTRRLERTGEMVKLTAVDPLNLVGILTPGPRVPALRTNLVVYRDGLPVGAPEPERGATIPRAARA